MTKKIFASFICSCLFFGLAAGKKSADLKNLCVTSDNTKRSSMQDEMQNIIDHTPKAEFDKFDADPLEKTSNKVLQYYDYSLDRIVADIPQTIVKPGTVVIWYLYNMGFVIKTPEICFGVDIHHRRAEKLEKLLDFVAVTHNHQDHYSMPLMRKMNAAKKLVISNFFPNSGYTKHYEYTHKLPGVTIHCYEADHNKRLRKFTMPMEFVCKTGDKNFVFYTSGDCWSHEFLNKKSDRIDLYVLHPRCGMKPVNAAKKLDPELTFIGHLQEMGHEINHFRWQFSVGRVELENLKQINKKAYVPVWAEKFIWDGEKITGCQK